MDVLEIQKQKTTKPRPIKKAQKAALAPKKHDAPTQKEYFTALEIADRFNLNLLSDFFGSRALVRLLIKCFGYQKDTKDAKETGFVRVKLLRDCYYYSSDPAWLTQKLNDRMSEHENFLSVSDINFMIEMLNYSDRPLQEEDISVQNPELLAYQD